MHKLMPPGYVKIYPLTKTVSCLTNINIDKLKNINMVRSQLQVKTRKKNRFKGTLWAEQIFVYNIGTGFVIDW